MVFVFGTVCIDRLRRVPELPAPGGYVEVEEEILMLGGEAANTATALVNWGADVSLAGNDLGTGPEATVLKSLLRKKGLPMDLLGEAEQPMTAPVCDIYLTPDGERTMFGLGFSHRNPSRTLESLPFRSGHWFTAEPNMGQRARDAVRVAENSGMRVYLMDFLREDDPIGPETYWQSSTDWAGHRGNMQKNLMWVKDFVEAKGCFAILSDGPNGFVAGSPTRPVRAYPPFPAAEVVDTTGAGDMFRAGMLYGLDQRWPLSRCLAFAAAAGCLKTRYLGATTHVPTVAEIEELICSQPEIAAAFGS